MASIIKRGKTWQYTVSRMIDGKSNPIRKGGFRSKKEASIAAAEVEADLQKGISPQSKLEPFTAYFREWLNVYKIKNSPITFTRYLNTYNTLLEEFGEKPIQNITKREYQAFLNKYALTHAKDTTKKLNTHIRACVREAIDEGIIRNDFTRAAVLTGENPTKRPEEKHLEYEESKRLMEAIYGRLERSLGYYLLLLALTSGMRFGELVGLTRKDFNFVNNTVNIEKTWDYKHDEGFGKTKNDQSVRVIDIDHETMTTFKNLFKTTPTNYLGLVFFSTQSSRRVLTNESVNKLLKNTLKELNIDPISIHGLRHTHASILLYRRVSIYYVSERLGHKDIDTTHKYYSHVIKELREEDAKSTIGTFAKMKSVINV